MELYYKGGNHKHRGIQVKDLGRCWILLLLSLRNEAYRVCGTGVGEMIKIATKTSMFKRNEIIFDNEAFFFKHFVVHEIDDNYIEALRIIDNAQILDLKRGIVLTPFGVTSINDVSTGCKMVLNYLTLMKHRSDFRGIMAINATEAGANAIEILFEIMERLNDNETTVVIEHKNKLYTCKNREYLINGEHKITDLIRL